MSSQDDLSAKTFAIPFESFLAFWIAMTDELFEEQKQKLAGDFAANATLDPAKTHEMTKASLALALARPRLFHAQRRMWTRSEPKRNGPSM